MTNYIEEMMKMAGVELKIVGCQSYIRTDNCDGLSCDSCNWYNTNKCYPNFTAEKQIELLKLIIEDNVIGFFKITQGLDKDYILFYEGCRSQHQDFTQALAQLTTELMNAGELDKEKVKEILEG